MKTNNSQKINQILPNIPHSVIPNQTVERNKKILPFVSHNNKSQRTLPVVIFPPNKLRAYTIPILPSPQNRRLQSSVRSRSNKNASYQSKKQTKKLSNPAPTLHITKKQSKLYNTFLHTNLFSSDSIGNSNLDSANKTNMSDNNNHNKLTPIHPKHHSNTIKFAKPIFSPIPPNTKKKCLVLPVVITIYQNRLKTNCKRTYLI